MRFAGTSQRSALDSFDAIVDDDRSKHPGAVECVTEDRDELLAFYDFPAEHGKHLRTTNPYSPGNFRRESGRLALV
jgi:transposase-like protein